MNRNWRESIAGGRNGSVLSQHRHGHSFTGISRDSDENLDLFSKNRRSLSVAASEDSFDASVKLGRLSFGSVKMFKSGIDDMLSSAEEGKHDYDWLLAPPGTPLFPSSSRNEVQSTVAAPRSSMLVGSSSTTKALRLSVSQSESSNPSRPSRSSSVSRSSVSAPQNSSYSNRSSLILNTSSGSVSSYVRPSSPSTRNSSIARTSTPSSRLTPSRSSTPSRARPSLTSSSIEKPRKTQSSRPSTPSSRPQIPANLSTPAPRSNSRPSTPTRRNSAPSLSSVVGTPSTGRILSTNGRSSTSSSRQSSPSPRVRAAPQPIVPPDFSLDTPPNLRITLPDRPISAGRSRPTPAASVRGSSEPTSTVNMPRRAASPNVSRGRLTDTPGRGRVNTNGHLSGNPESRTLSSSSDLGGRRPVRTSSTSTAESNGYGRSISKKSLDVATRHMDIRNGPGIMRSGSGNTLFPHSIRSATSKTPSVTSSNSNAIDTDFQKSSNNNMERGNHFHPDGGENGRFCGSLNHLDMYESSHYESILLKEDLKNTNWLHSTDDKTDLGSILDYGFEALPEPFGLL
ncbi:hypothetical protein SDJN02_11538 [Cucurbita argyrosperma subsp. argyrosperma]|nr:hypothetical protein SDJN02_11538 [Cucurbita argyrosperma subsp. argyrosperma]